MSSANAKPFWISAGLTGAASTLNAQELAPDASRPLEARQQAHRALDGYLKACLMCGFKPADLESPAEQETRRKANEVSGF